MIREFTDEIIECLEDGRVEVFRIKAAKGSVPAAVVKEILPDVRYPVPAKRTAKIATPRVAAKWLNKSGVSAEYADEVALIGAIGAIFAQGRKLNAKLDELIAAAKQTKPEEKKT